MIPPTDPGAMPPGPPYSRDVLADLHAGVLPDDVAAHLTATLTRQDRAVLAALDRTLASLAHLPVEPVPVPDHVRAMTERTLAAIAAEVSAPAAGTDDLAGRRRGRWIAGGAGLAAAAAIAVVVALSVSVWRSPGTHQQQPVATPEQSATHTPGADTPSADPVAMLSVFGRTDAAPFGSTERLRRCTAANGVAGTVPVVGSGPLTLSARPAAVILLGTTTPGKFTALVVGTDCDTDHPSTISRTIIGH